MAVLKAHHWYVNKKPKGSRFINEILPRSDIEVSQVLFDSFEDVTEGKIKDQIEERFKDE